MAVDLLQRIGLNKYEAEAYLALLTDGPLTGYELGKRSSVPLSKSYETLERLVRRGLALVQPGDPPRYLAEQPERFLAQTRSDQETVLTALASALAEQQRADPADQFWVVRGRANVLNRARALIERASEIVALGQWPAIAELSEALGQARARGCRVTVQAWGHPVSEAASDEFVALLVDGGEALVGTLAPATQCQAVVSGNPGLVMALQLALIGREAERDLAPAAAEDRRESTWIDWEARKQDRLRRLAQAGRVA
jgi:HTH-type transcriptional regulator, sugar sensing transcriptional regulator